MSRSPEEKRALRTRTFLIRMTPEEHTDALACAQTLGVSLARLMRSRAEALPPPRADLAVATELTRIGTNLNQIAHTLNSGFDANRDELKDLLLNLRNQVADLRGQFRRRP